MKGSKTIQDKPFRYGGISHDYDMTSEDFTEYLPEHMSKCFICGGRMRNIRSLNGTLLKRTYPYAGFFKITKGKNKGFYKFRLMCRSCAYNLGKGVIEMDGYTYQDKNDFNEKRYKEAIASGICANCKHLRKHNGDLAEFVCDRKGSVVKDTRVRECDELWEGEKE